MKIYPASTELFTSDIQSSISQINLIYRHISQLRPPQIFEEKLYPMGGSTFHGG